MLKVKKNNEYKNVDLVYYEETEIEQIYDKNGNLVFDANNEIEDEAPISFQGKKSANLKNYRIYGNTVNGESVGDRTRNLFDGSFIHRSVIETIVGDDNPNRRAIVVDVSSYANGNKITFSRETSAGNQLQMYQVSSPLKGGVLLNGNVFSGNSETLLATITLDNISNYPYLMIFLNGASNPITDEELLASKIMVNVGNTPLPYEPYGYRVPVTVANGTDTVTTNLYLPEQIKMVGNEAEYADYKEQKQHRVRKNLLQNTVTSQTVNEVAFTVNDDKSITLSRTSESDYMSLMGIKNGYDTTAIGSYDIPIFFAGESIISSTNSDITLRARYTDGTYLGSITNNVPIEFVKDVGVIYIQVDADFTGSTTVYPMIRKADISDDTYEPYIEDTELDVTLPAIPTLSGTNTLSVGTDVQPSNIEITGKIKGVE